MVLSPCTLHKQTVNICTLVCWWQLCQLCLIHIITNGKVKVKVIDGGVGHACVVLQDCCEETLHPK